VALVARFTESITTQEFDAGLARVSDSAALLAGAHHASSFVWPHMFAFDDLARLSFCDVRHGTIMASAARTRTNGGTTAPFPIAARAQRRSATFLRYLVGCCVGTAGILDHGNRRARFADCLRSVMRASLPDAQDVGVIYDGRFYTPLWDGLRTYQARRLVDVAALLAARGITAPDLAASVALTKSRNETRAQFAFLRRGTKLDQHIYHIPLEPQADPLTAIARMVAPLRSLGVKVYITRQAAPIRFGDCHEVERGSRVARLFELALPL
jgi:hypothetical protein